ncbi:MAG: glycerol dehydrogenase [Sphaerochaetaceae bacterium]|nr:glycerol dehydrogenase [Sphaerochaetaceae bacterium]MDC7250569.1 glycerol dehydrogenase [Sphaerochaetaceae bacterium]
MAMVIGGPSRYIQQKNALKDLSKFAKTLGNNLLVLITESGKKRIGNIIEDGNKDTDVTINFTYFNGECSKKEIKRVQDEAKKVGANVIVGIGGGKALDTAKAAAYYAKLPVVISPTIASSDAPCSALSVIYTEEGVYEEYLFLTENPNMVLMDTEIISKAPSRLIVAGMGDALATYFEARACKASNAINCLNGTGSLTSTALGELCYQTLINDGYKAKLAADNKVCTKAVENIIEANTYLSGIGFESGGIAAAHAVHNGLTAIEETHHMYHGEKVAFGTLTQLVLENAPIEDIEEVIEFCTSVGLPTTLADLGIKKIKEEEIMKVATLACAEGDTMANMPFDVTPNDVYAAILAANELGLAYKN